MLASVFIGFNGFYCAATKWTLASLWNQKVNFSTVLWPPHFHKSGQIHLKCSLLSAFMEDRGELTP